MSTRITHETTVRPGRELLLDTALVTLRIAAGGFLLPHGLAKLFGWFDGPGLSGFAAELQGFALPSFAPFPGILAFLQTLLGLSVLLGAWTRLSATLAMVFIGVTVILNISNGWFWNHHGAEYPVFWSLVLFSLLLMGGGHYSLDTLIRRYHLPGYEDECCDS
ncbi:DoxX family protein [Luteimonas saliphila]|uniref:DoxX family protein n=1 Tax=Luteimonas saliphila TaxID=2804919 RepID=UPI00192D2E1C|nr:DoxX family protein [Luteimonas saliphila]